MTLSGYVSGVIGLTKDFVRFGFELLKRPHYVAVLIALFLGAFYACGVPPREIPQVVQKKWRLFIANRKSVLSEELQLISDRIDDDGNPLKKKMDELAGRLNDSERARKQNEPLFVRAGVFHKENLEDNKEKFNVSAAALPDLSGGNVVQGELSVVGANKIRVAGRLFSLKVRIRSGKAGEAYAALKRKFDGIQAKCLPDPSDSGLADCFVGALGVSEMLIDFGYAEPL